MKAPVTFFVVTVFTTLFLESSTAPVESTAVTKGWQLLSDIIEIDEVSTTGNTRSFGIVTGNIFGNIQKITDKIISDVGKTASVVGETVKSVVTGTTNVVNKVASDVKTAIDDIITAKQALSTLVKSKVALKSSALPEELKLVLGNALSDSDTELFRKLLGEFVANRVASSETALARVDKAVDGAWKKAKGPEKAPLTEVKNWMTEVVPMLNVLHADTLSAVASGTKEDLGNVIPRLSDTIEQRTPEVAKNIALLGATPGKQTSSVLVTYTEDCTIISINANLELQALRLLKISASS